jgi:hypothetical protein
MAMYSSSPRASNYSDSLEPDPTTGHIIHAVASHNIEWTSRHFYLPRVRARMQRMKNKRAAECKRKRRRICSDLLYKENQQLSHLNQMPVEVILDIIDCLGGADIFCLRLTSPYFNDIYKNYTSQVWPQETSDVKREVTIRLERDTYAQQAILETEINTRHLDKLLCSTCRTFYPRKFFSSNARAQSADTRVCIRES